MGELSRQLRSESNAGCAGSPIASPARTCHTGPDDAKGFELPDWLTLHVAALVLVAAVFGGMIFFMAVFAPAVFRFMPREDAARFMRALFPVYFLTMGVVSLLPALILSTVASYRLEAATLLAVAAVFFAQRFVLLPALNRSRESDQDGRASGLHRLSVVVHLVQWVAVLAAFLRLSA